MENVLIQLLAWHLWQDKKRKKDTNSSILKTKKKINEENKGVKQGQLCCSWRVSGSAPSWKWIRTQRQRSSLTCLCGKRGWSDPGGLMKEEYEKRHWRITQEGQRSWTVCPDLDRSAVSVGGSEDMEATRCSFQLSLLGKGEIKGLWSSMILSFLL